MRKNIIYFLSLLFISVVAGNGIKIGYIHSQQIMDELDDVREVFLQVEKEQRKFEAELTGMMEKRDSLIQSYQVQKILIEEHRRVAKEKEIEDLERRIQTFQMEKFGTNSGEIYKIQNQLFAPVQARIAAAIQKVGDEQGYDYILDAVTGALVYWNPDHNLTVAVIEELRQSAIDNNGEN